MLRVFLLSSTSALTATDSTLGRLDHASLSDQALMEMVVAGVEADLFYKDVHGNFLDVKGLGRHRDRCRWCGSAIRDFSKR